MTKTVKNNNFIVSHTYHIRQFMSLKLKSQRIVQTLIAKSGHSQLYPQSNIPCD